MSEDVETIPDVNIYFTEKRTNPRLEALLFADYAAIATDGKVVVCGIFDRLLVNPETKQSGLFYIFIRTAETTEGGIQIGIYDPENKLVISADTDFVDPNDKENTRRTTILQRLALNNVIEGEYWVEVAYKGQTLGGVVLVAEFVKQEQSNGRDKSD